MTVQRFSIKDATFERSPGQEADVSTGNRLAIATLFLGAFVLGSSETMPVGLLTAIAHTTGTAVGPAGTLVTAYALSVAFGGVLLSFATAAWTRRRVLFVALAAALGSNLLVAASDSLPVLLAARVVGGAAHGWFVGAALAVAMTIVPPDRIGRAVAVVLTGFAASTALGVPAGVGIAALLGWHASFGVVAVLVGVVILGVALSVPSARQADATPARDQVRHALAPKVLGLLAIALALFAGHYAAFTYVSPYLQAVTGVSEAAVGWYVLAFGLAAMAGSIAGGWLADRDPRTTLLMASLAIPAVLAALLAFGASEVASFAIVLAWGMLVVVFVPSIQALVSEAAGPGRDLAAVLPASAIHLGIAGGSLLGGVGTSLGGASTPLVIGILICALAVPPILALWHGRPKPAAT